MHFSIRVPVLGPIHMGRRLYCPSEKPAAVDDFLAKFALAHSLKSDPQWVAFQSAAKQLLSGIQEAIVLLPECPLFLTGLMCCNHEPTI